MGKRAHARQALGSLCIPYSWCSVTHVKEEKKQQGSISLCFSVVIDSLQRTLALMTVHACHLSRRRWAKWELPLVSSRSTWCWKVGVATPGHTTCSDVTVSSEKMMKGKGGRKRSRGCGHTQPCCPHRGVYLPQAPVPAPGPVCLPGGVPTVLPGGEGSHRGWDLLWDARSWIPSAAFP